jgi:nitroimidazol reductase NimA-like FMN-containing flavoprotein (pyridoxamine 5'-phosphate oxidase superfamily)
MRYKDLEIDRKRIARILNDCTVLRLGLNDDPYPYIVPLNYVYDSGFIYFHSAMEGRKIELLKRNKHICFEVDKEIGIRKSVKPCDWGAQYESVFGTGMAELIMDNDEKRKILGKLMRKYSGSSQWTFSPEVVEKTALVRIIIDTISGKASY